MKKLIGFLKEEEGATAVEYALMVAAIAVVIIVAVFALGRTISTIFDDVGTNIQNAS